MVIVTMVITHSALVCAAICLVKNHPCLQVSPPPPRVCLGGRVVLVVGPLPSFAVLLWAPCWCRLLWSHWGAVSHLSHSHSHSQPGLLSPGAWRCGEKPFLFCLAAFCHAGPKAAWVVFSVSLSSLPLHLKGLPPQGSGRSLQSKGRERKMETRHSFLSTPRLPFLSSFLPPKAATKPPLSSGFLESNQLLTSQLFP